MISRILRKPKDLHFEHTYSAPIDTVWQAWTDPEMLRHWWGPEGTAVITCEVDAVVEGEIHVVTEAGESMGKYAGTRWPMHGVFTRVTPTQELSYDARSWTEGEEAGSTIHHTNTVRLRSEGSSTVVTLDVAITAIGPKAKMAAFGMKWGYKSQLKALEEVLA